MVCKLCSDEVSKLAKSHIIPQSLYGSAFDDPKGPLKIYSSARGVRPSRSPVGEYDPNLMCGKCESSLSDVDDYAQRILTKTEPVQIIRDEDVALLSIYGDVEINKLRLFFITLLWRMHATDRPMFNIVRLGKYESKFKQATLELNPNAIPEMDVILAKYDVFNTSILGPMVHRIGGVNGYSVSFAGWSCWLKIDSRKTPSLFAEIALSNGNPLRVLRRQFSSSPEAGALIKILKQHIK